MQINKAKFERVVADAKAKTTDRRWLNAIDKAADAIINGKWVVTQLFHCYVFTTESGKTYKANGVCQCEAFFRDQPCKHRAATRLLDLYNETADEVEIGLEANVSSKPISRADVIASINAAWPKDLNLADELMRRFRVNSLNFLADDMLAGVLAAIA